MQLSMAPSLSTTLLDTICASVCQKRGSPVGLLSPYSAHALATMSSTMGQEYCVPQQGIYHSPHFISAWIEFFSWMQQTDCWLYAARINRNVVHCYEPHEGGPSVYSTVLCTVCVLYVWTSAAVEKFSPWMRPQILPNQLARQWQRKLHAAQCSRHLVNIVDVVKKCNINTSVQCML